MRVIEKKRPPLMTKKRWLYVLSVCLLALVLWFIFYYREIQSPRWSEISAMEVQALETTELVRIDNSHKHVWDQVSFVMEGVNEQDEALIVWMTAEGESTTRRMEDGIPKEAMKKLFNQSEPDAVVNRIELGMIDGIPAWEVYYKGGNGSKHMYYSFYNFRDGAYIDTYQLPAKTEP